MANYKSEFTGAEHDLVVRKNLGPLYKEGADPGSILIGTISAAPVNLFEVVLPGKYTIVFYYDADFNEVPIEMPFQGNSPIFMEVTYINDRHLQRIQIGATLCWRDLASGDYTWKVIDMGVEKTLIIDNLTSTNKEAALSANQGRVLKVMIDNLDIGNMNLCNNSALARGTEGWILPEGASRDTNVRFFDKATFDLDASALSSPVDNLTVGCYSAYDASIIPAGVYTGSVWVKADTPNTIATIQISIFDGAHSEIPGAGKRYDVTLSPPADGVWTKIAVVTANTYVEAAYVKIVFSVSNNGHAHFALPKLELGTYGTQWMPSYYDMWSEFDNANFINEIFVDIENIQNQQSIVYNGELEKFVNEYVAVGGGGGFVQSKTPPSNHQVLWFNLSEVSECGGKFYRYNNETNKWEKAIPSTFLQQNTAPPDIDRAWIDMSNSDSIHPGLLMYYDLTMKQWRPVAAAPGKNWEFGETPPENKELMWIKLPQFTLHFWYDGAWTPIHAIWGKNDANP